MNKYTYFCFAQHLFLFNHHSVFCGMKTPLLSLMSASQIIFSVVRHKPVFIPAMGSLVTLQGFLPQDCLGIALYLFFDKYCIRVKVSIFILLGSQVLR